MSMGEESFRLLEQRAQQLPRLSPMSRVVLRHHALVEELVEGPAVAAPRRRVPFDRELPC